MSNLLGGLKSERAARGRVRERIAREKKGLGCVRIGLGGLQIGLGETGE